MKKNKTSLFDSRDQLLLLLMLLFYSILAASDNPGPVKWYQPYFDCERSNKWVFGATVPIPDIYPRHTQWRHIEIPT